jgi:hypothetical protein
MPASFFQYPFYFRKDCAKYAPFTTSTDVDRGVSGVSGHDPKRRKSVSLSDLNMHSVSARCSTEKTGVRIQKRLSFLCKHPGFLFSGKPVVWFDFSFFKGIILRVQHHHKHYRDAQTKCIGRTEASRIEIMATGVRYANMTHDCHARPPAVTVTGFGVGRRPSLRSHSESAWRSAAHV